MMLGKLNEMRQLMSQLGMQEREAVSRKFVSERLASLWG